MSASQTPPGRGPDSRPQEPSSARVAAAAPVAGHPAGTQPGISQPAIYQLFSCTARVYWEDTDAGEVVYHARYAHFLERARSEWLRSLGVEQRTLRERDDLVFAVASMTMRFRRPARLDDLLVVTSHLQHVGGASLRFAQQVLRDGELLLDAEVRAVCLAASSFRPRAVPEWLLAGPLTE